MDEEAAAALAPVIAQLTTLRELDLNCVSQAVQRAMAPAVRALIQLTSLSGLFPFEWTDMRRLAQPVWFST